jgi:hypothetical protein
LKDILLSSLKDKPITSSPPSPKKETWVHGYGHHPCLVPSLGEVPRYRITITFIIIYLS